jgi:L-2,4-diaminobutyrate decarboxylase
VKTDPIRAAFSADGFRATGHELVDRLADYLARATAGAVPVLPAAGPAALAELFPPRFPDPGSPSFGALVARVLEGSNHLHHPRYVGHQVTAPLPEAALAELVSAFLNNSMAVYEMGPVSTAMERSVVLFLASRVGFGAGSGGVLTSGGSAGNLTALLAARQAKAGHDAWTEGAARPLAILVSEQAHYSIARSASIMGLGKKAVFAVPVDAAFKLRPEALEPARRRAESEGRRVIAVVGSACSTATGSFDPLEPIAEFAREHVLWFHVDGAHGAAAALSEKYRGLLRGIERADSVVWDAHKMMLVPSLATAVLFRDDARSYEAFAQEASYLFQGEREWWNVAPRTLECTKRMMSLPLYSVLATRGPAFLGDYVTRMFDLARTFAAALRREPDFEVAVTPEANIVCFRHRAGDDVLQERIRRRILSDGSFYLVQTKLADRVFLRVTLMNPLTTEGDLTQLVETVREAARA